MLHAPAANAAVRTRATALSAAFVVAVFAFSGVAHAENPVAGNNPARQTKNAEPRAKAPQPPASEPQKSAEVSAQPQLPAPLSTSSPTGEKPVRVGVQAPPLGIEHWLKGTKVDGLVPGRAYVVEFWATWCTPCKANIPHLTLLAKKYPNVTVIGVAINEAGGKKPTKEHLDKLKAFVKKQGDKMDYVVAYDEDGDMDKRWLDAAGIQTIPTSFVIDPSGKIAWIGSPSSQPDKFERAMALVDSEVSRTRDRVARSAKAQPQRKAPVGAAPRTANGSNSRTD